MAYAFDRIMNAMGRQKKDEPAPMEAGGGRQAPGASAANPAGRTAPLQAQANLYGSAPAAPGGDTGRVRAATTEGALPQAGGGSGAPAAAAPGQEQTPASRGRLFTQNAGKAGSPVDLSELGNRIQGTKDKVGRTADSYVANAGSYYTPTISNAVADSIKGIAGFGPSDRTSDSYLDIPAGGMGGEPIPTGPSRDGSDEDSDQYDGPFLPNYDAAYTANPVSDASWSEAYTQGPGQVSDFSLPFNTDMADADLMSTDAGIQEAFRRGGDAEYTTGDSAFDMALLRKNSAFNALRANTLDQNRSLQQLAGTVGDDATERGQEALDTSYKGWRNSVTGALESSLADIEREGTGRETAFDENLTSQISKNAAKKPQKYADKAIASLIADNPELKAQIEEAVAMGYDPMDYFSSGGLTADDTSWQDFTTGNEAQGFNTIKTLLGGGGAAMAPGQYTDAKYGDNVSSSFDDQAFTDMLLGRLEEIQNRPPPEELVVDKGRVDYPRTPPRPHGSGVPPGTVAIDTYGEYGPTDLSGTTTIDPNSVSPVSVMQPGGFAPYDLAGDGGQTSGGSTVTTGNQQDGIDGQPSNWWLPDYEGDGPLIGGPSRNLRRPTTKRFPNIRGQMSR